ncbi:hypothetical protein FHS83_001980 [Rhizomicrobium palustre]|uniref:Uncharacterized protein n=1 Tax=Rhizomicrobium palustre TaxID=189966 RepID=A0A846N078_9PROT|nr:DUF4908 domain-containing protein [Rhizomicrobium palustre]NIK88662.1 hypothetical protein [Rhizomicrobium palustre]
MRAFALLFGAFLVCAPAVQAQAGVFDSGLRFSDISPGTYQAGDTRFTLDRYQNAFLMRYVGQPEIFVLYANYGSMGVRVLQFDSGGTAIQVTGWGGMTAYTDDHPEGMPTAKVGDSTAPVLAAVSVAQIQGAADDEAAHLTSSRGLKISIQADQATLNEGAVRALAYDTLENAARGIDRFTANPAARNVFGQRVTAVRIAIADRPYIRIADKVLIVTFNPRTGYFGRASSKAISFALGKMFGIPSN